MTLLENAGRDQRPNVLIVDDVRSNQQVLAALLEQDYQVQVAGNGLRALEIARSAPHPDLILLDVNMPDMSGYEICRRLLESPQSRDIPVIFVTAASDQQSEIEGLELGAADYISKPINPVITLLRVRNLMLLRLREQQRRQAAQQLKDSEKYLHALFDATPDAMLISDRQGVIKMSNRQAERLLGYAHGELPGMAIEALVPWSSRAAHPAMRTQFAAAAVARPMGAGTEVRVLRKDGSEVDVEISLSPIQTNQGLFFASALRDITERKQASLILRQLKAMIDISLDGFLMIDLLGDVLQVNEAYAKMIGYSIDELVNKNINQLKALEESEQVKGYIEKIISHGYDLFESQHRHKDGHIVNIEVSAAYLHEFQQFCLFCRDITGRKRIEQQLRIAATAFQSQEAMVITDIESVILQVNKAFCETTGYSEAEAVGHKISLLKSGRHDRAFYQAMWQSLLADGSWQGEVWDRRKNGEIYPKWLSITAVKDQNGVTSHYVGTHTDITERKAAEEKIRQLAFYDPLTQLPNRRLLEERLKHSICREHRDGGQLALLMLDLDRFKAVNDSLGHLAGDELLRQVAARTVSRLRDVDMVARLGGDEFIVLLEDIANPKAAAKVAEQIIASLGKPFTLSQSDHVHIGVSIGIALHPQHGDTAHRLMDRADAALYQAKASGRGSYAYFSEELTLAAQQRLLLETRLRSAIEEQQLRLYYQPQVDIASGRVIGVEALVRWQDPGEGLISPERFIPIAEESNLIVEIGAWVLREACRQGRQWLDEGLPPITLAVNVSAQQFYHSEICALVDRTLQDTGFPAAQLELEITESGLLGDMDSAVAVFTCLRSLGVGLAIDDFGTGFSSLSYLKHFPLNLVKIDKSFIDDIPFQRDDMEIAATIIAMSHVLGFKVLAEGVETAEQLAFLQEKQCDSYQGHIASKALPPGEISLLLRNGQVP